VGKDDGTELEMSTELRVSLSLESRSTLSILANVVRNRSKTARIFGFPFSGTDGGRIDKVPQSRVVKRAVVLNMFTISDRSIPNISISNTATAQPFKPRP
jgi:hypothetical protein